MRALSIRQPWAWMILNAGKDIENRDWPTSVRGRILIHASKRMTEDEYYKAAETAIEARSGRGYPPCTLPPRTQLERGGIVGSVELVDCVGQWPSPWFFGDFGFVLRDPKPLPFVPFKGKLGFFDVPDEILSANSKGD